MQLRCQEYEADQEAQGAAVQEFHNVLSQFCGSLQPADHSTPKLGATALKEDGSWAELESSVENLRSLWSPGKGPSVSACRSPLRHTTGRARHSLNIGARRDPVGSIGELVAKAARDRSARSGSQHIVLTCSIEICSCVTAGIITQLLTFRCKGNQENTPDLAESKKTPTSGAPHRGHSSIARSPLSSINSPMYPASAIADPETGYICMHTNMLAFSGRRSSTPCLESASYDPDMVDGDSAQLGSHPVSSGDCPKTPDSCRTTAIAKQVCMSS